MRDRRLAVANLIERIVVFIPTSRSFISIAATPSSAHVIVSTTKARLSRSERRAASFRR
jgi:hypothetical protein